MDSWKFYNIVHRCHRVMNPVNEDRLERLYDLLELKQGARVIDVGCGKGEMLIRLAEKYHVKGLRVDKSPYWYAAAEYALSNPQDPDSEELSARVSNERESYLRWGRETLGWAIYLFRNMKVPTRG